MCSPKKKPHHPPRFKSAVPPPVCELPQYIVIDKQIAGFGCKTFYVAAIPQKEAVTIIRANHYSGRIVNNSYVHLGVYLDGEMVGVLQFGYALNPSYASKVVRDTGNTEYLELNRMWLSDKAPRNSESRAISYAIKYIKRACPSVRWIQSFADERCGRWGVVYQAANFLYLGSHKSPFWKLDGTIYHNIVLTASKRNTDRNIHLRDNIERARKTTLRQFRYIYFVKPRYKKDLNMTVKPYPKPERC